MLAADILAIIRLSLEITLEVIKGIPIEQRQAMWERHEQRIQFWQNLFERVSKEAKP
jgi:hypothetical protein